MFSCISPKQGISIHSRHLAWWISIEYGPALFNVDMFGSVEEKSYVTTGSGSPVAYGLLEDEYRDDLKIEDAKVSSSSSSESCYCKKYWYW